MKILYLLAFACLSTAGCADIPKDPDKTLERIRSEHQYKVGIIGSGAPLAPDRQRLFLSMVSNAAQAQPKLEEGAAEPLLAKLEEGELDLVIGAMAPHSPWSKNVSFLPPLAEEVKTGGHTHLVAMAKNGENAWISLLHSQARKVAAAQ